ACLSPRLRAGEGVAVNRTESGPGAAPGPLLHLPRHGGDTTRARTPPAAAALLAAGACSARWRRASKPPAKADVGEEAGRLLVEPPADADADLQVRRDQVVHAGAEEVPGEVARPALGELAEILGVDLEALAQRHPQNGGRRPHHEAVAVVAVGG